MATVKAVVFKHQEKEDGTFNVKFRITHNRKSAYISSSYFVTRGQLTKDFELKAKGNFIYDEAMKDLLAIRGFLASFSHGLDGYSAKEIASFVEKKIKGTDAPQDRIRIKDFAANYINGIRSEGTRKSYQTRLSGICGFFGNNVCFGDISYKRIKDFERYLLGERNIKAATVNHYMTFLSSLFIQARKMYNEEDLGVTPIRNPFAKYKRLKAARPASRSWSAEEFRQLLTMDLSPLTEKRKVAFDVVVISFLLCGINTADLYDLGTPENGYVHYYRQKTRDRKSDRSEMRIKVQPELTPFLEKYKDPNGKRAFCFYLHSPSSDRFTANISQLASHIRRVLHLDGFMPYMSRHTWATVAYNDLGINESDIAFCLTHSTSFRTTDFYIQKDFSKVDEINRKVIDFVFYGKK